MPTVKKSWIFDKLQILLLKEEDLWVAQCLDHDVASQGPDIRGVLRAWEHAFFAQAMANIDAGMDPMENASAAPEFYWKKFDSGLRLSETIAVTGAAADELSPPPVRLNQRDGSAFRPKFK